VMPLHDLAFEYRMYLPLAAVVTTVVLGVFATLSRATQRRWLSPGQAALAGASLAAAAIVSLGVVTYRRNEDYRSHVAIWQDTVKKAPHNPRALNNLGYAFIEEGEFDAAIRCLQDSLELSPDSGRTRVNLGCALLCAGRAEEALTQYGKLLRYEPESPVAHKGLGDALLTAGRIQEAIPQYTEALRLAPHCPSVHNNLGYALARGGVLDEAIVHYRAELELCPDSALAHLNLADALLCKGDASAAIAECESALQLEPGNAKVQSNLAWLLATAVPPQRTDAGRALSLAQQACRSTEYRQAASLDVLAAAYAAASRFAEAVDTAERALRLLPPAASTPAAARIADRLSLYRQGRPFHLGSSPAPEGSPLPGGINVL